MVKQMSPEQNFICAMKIFDASPKGAYDYIELFMFFEALPKVQKKNGNTIEETIRKSGLFKERNNR